MRLGIILAAAAFCVSALTARADTFETFDLNATFLGAGTITGTVNLDMSGLYTLASTADLTYTNGATTVLFNGYNYGVGETFNSPYIVDFTFYNSSFTDIFTLKVPVATEGSLAGFTGGLCTYSDSASCNYTLTELTLAGSYAIGAFSGTFTPDIPPAATPEPTSLALLGTGILVIAEPVRRRLRRTA